MKYKIFYNPYYKVYQIKVKELFFWDWATTFRTDYPLDFKTKEDAEAHILILKNRSVSNVWREVG